MPNSPYRYREAILVIGPPGAGKSSTWLDIAKHFVKGLEGETATTTPHLYLVDNEADSFDRLLEGKEIAGGTHPFLEIPGKKLPYTPDIITYGDMVSIYRPETWVDYSRMYDYIRGVNGKNRESWLVTDTMDKIWSVSQEYFSEAVNGKTITEWSLSHKATGGVGSPLADAHGQNWGVINKMYAEATMPILRFPGHKLYISPAEAISTDKNGVAQGVDPEIVKIFGKSGVKPAGNKKLAFLPSTILLLKEGLGGYGFTSLKDRERELHKFKKLDNGFYQDYLVDVAGWAG